MSEFTARAVHVVTGCDIVAGEAKANQSGFYQRCAWPRPLLGKGKWDGGAAKNRRITRQRASLDVFVRRKRNRPAWRGDACHFTRSHDRHSYTCDRGASIHFYLSIQTVIQNHIKISGKLVDLGCKVQAARAARKAYLSAGNVRLLCGIHLT